jgi:hypothetical protein
MPFSRYTTKDEWLATIETMLGRSDIQEAITQRNLPVDAIRAVARAEALGANEHGATSVSADAIAGELNLPLHLVKRCRIGLIEVGLEVLVEPSSATSAATGQLQLPRI